MSLDWSMINQTVQALGWALVHFLWQGALVGAVFAAGNLALRKAAPVWRYGLGLACLTAIALAPLVTFLLTLERAQPAAVEASVLALPALSVAGGAVAAGGMDFAAILERGLPWVVFAWGLGVLGHSLRVYVNWRRMGRLTRVGVRPVSRAIRKQTIELSRLLGIRRAVAIFESSIVEVPTVLGWLKPVILLPTATLVGLTPRQIELVIAHELGHVRRWDYVVNLLQVSVETALFYHPVVGWISRRVREEREKCCDDLVVSHCGNRLEYAKALHNLESIRSGDVSPALAATDGKLFERIERIVSHRGAEPREAFAGNTLFLVLLGVAVLAAGRMADPVSNLELRRALLADTLVQEMLIATMPRHTEALMAPLENARLRPVEARVTPSVEADTAPVRSEVTVARDEIDPPAARRTVATVTSSDTVPAEPTPATVTTRELPPVTPAPVAQDAPGEQALVEPVNITVARIEPPSLPVETAEAAQAPALRGPMPIERRAPEYPVRARMAGKTGFVELSFAVADDGTPYDIRVDDAYPRRVFEKSSLRALRQWRFDRGTAATGVDRVTQRFDFNLAHSSPLLGAGQRECQPITGTRICRSDSPTFLKSREAASN